MPQPAAGMVIVCSEWRRRAPIAALLSLLFLVSLSACDDRLLSPDSPVSVQLTPDLAAVPEFAQQGEAVIDSIFVVLQSDGRSYSAGAYWPPDQAEIELEVAVQLTQTEETFDFRLELWVGPDLVLESEGSFEVTRSGAENASEVVTANMQPAGERARAQAMVVTDPPGPMLAGDTLRLSATVYDSDEAPMEGVPLSWESLSPGVATVDSDGLVQAGSVPEGSALIRAFVPYTTVADTVEVTVVAAGIAILPVAVSALVGDTLTFTAQGLDVAGEPVDGVMPVTWSVADPGVAEVVDADGSTVRVAALAEGATTVSAAYTLDPAMTASAELDVAARVGDQPIVATFGSFTLVLAPGSATAWTGHTVQFTATVLDQDGEEVEDAEVTWASSNPAIAQVDGSGLATARAEGTARIGVSHQGFAIAATLTVEPVPLASITLAPDSVHFTAIGETLRLEATVVDSAGDTAAGVALEWTALDIRVATVDYTGRVTARGDGTTGIVAAADGVADTAVVSVAAGVSDVMAAGRDHSCVLTDTGRAYCWGSNSLGQLGTGSGEEYSATPVAVAGGHSFSAIAAVQDVTCALDAQGQAWCWGANQIGQIGDGTTENRSTPTLVAGGHRFVEISVGWAVCARTADGEAFCWGDGRDGNLGSTAVETCGTIECSTVPRPVSTSLRFRALDVGMKHVCALTGDGEAYCWGWGVFGQLGDGTTQSRVAVQPVATELRFRSIVSGTVHSCGIEDDGSAHCWGYNAYGQAGIGEASGSTTPEPVVGGLHFASMTASKENYIAGHTCGITFDGASYCWGGDAGEQLGSGTEVPMCGSWPCSTSPLPVAGGVDFRALATGQQHTCAVSDGGQPYCWGREGLGQLGTGAIGFALEPVPVSGGTGIAALSAGNTSGCMVTDGGETRCWGDNAQGQLGDGTLDARRVPATISSTDEFADVSVGSGHACGLTTAGDLRCWGLNSSGQLGDGTTTQRLTPAPVDITVAASQVSAGINHSCALDTDGVAYCWGANHDGQIGDGTNESRSVPTAVAGEHVFTGIAAGNRSTCGVTPEGEVLCWGWNQYGQLGDGTTTARAVPAPVASEAGFVHVTIRSSHACAVTAVGDAYCWGFNGAGQLGDGSTEMRLAPVAVSGGFTFTALDAGWNHTCGIRDGGSVACWGQNWGRFGDGSFTHSTAPVAGASGLQVASTSAGALTTCSITTGGAAYCSGLRGYLGDGSTGTVPVPALVAGGLQASPPPLAIRGDAGHGDLGRPGGARVRLRGLQPRAPTPPASLAPADPDDTRVYTPEPRRQPLR